MTSIPKSRITGISLLILAALGIWGWSLFSPGDDPSPSEARSAGPGNRSTSPDGSGSQATKTDRSPTPGSADDSPAAALDTHFSSMTKAATPEEARAQLKELRTFLSGLDPAVAADLVTRFIESGRDTELPLAFKISDGGFLETPPTFRVALLDMLGWVNPEQAAALGKQILTFPSSPDEWAVSLRNIGKHQPDEATNTLLREKTEELIRNPSWQENPSVGYLNAFDVLVHTKATESTPLLSELIQRKDRRDLAHASFLTLDRLTQREPVKMLTQLKDDTALQTSRPEMVAQQFSRADLRNDAQRELVRSWMLDPARTENELGSFAGIFPNNNHRISKNLLTPNTSHSGAELLAHDRAVLILVTQWQQDPAFESVRPHLNTMAHRLHQFTSGPRPSPGP